MVPSPDAVPRVGGDIGGGKDVLPTQFLGGVGILAGERVREPDRAQSLCQIALVKGADKLDLDAQLLGEAGGQDHHAILAAFAIADDDLAVIENDVLDAQSQSLLETQSRTVKKTDDQPDRALQAAEDIGDLRPAEDDWNLAE